MVENCYVEITSTSKYLNNQLLTNNAQYLTSSRTLASQTRDQILGPNMNMKTRDIHVWAKIFIASLTC